MSRRPAGRAPEHGQSRKTPRCNGRRVPRVAPLVRLDTSTSSPAYDAEMMLNLVRLRYDDTPLFLELGTVVAQYGYDLLLTLPVGR